MKLNYALTAANATASIHLGTLAQESVKRVYCHLPRTIPVAARSKAWDCSRSLAGIVGSNPAGIIDASLMGVLCVVREVSLRRADHSSRGVLPSVACLSVITKS